MRTVFVIGAGANVEIGMPSGDELKTKIAKLLDFTKKSYSQVKGDDIIYNALLQHTSIRGLIIDYKVNEIINIAVSVSKAMSLSISIDNFIEARKDNKQIALCGKMAITRAILNAEQNCALFTANNENPFLFKNTVAELNNSWYTSLFKKITEGCHIDELPERLNNISFIIFNYDRCFEYFMYNALMVYYNIDHEGAKKLIQGMDIIHPYGTVGELWDEQGKLAFGREPHQGNLVSLAENIITFTENIRDNSNHKRRIKYITERGDRLIFLGFAYHDQNISLLFDQPHVSSNDNIPLSERIVCYGTGYNISETDLKHISNSLKEANFKIVECVISNITCTQFFKDFWYTLSFKEEDGC